MWPHARKSGSRVPESLCAPAFIPEPNAPKKVSIREKSEHSELSVMLRETRSALVDFRTALATRWPPVSSNSDQIERF